jgi:phosphatidylglycerophosphate synthase
MRHLPNLLSALRILCAPALIALICLDSRQPFAWLLVAALISDILDGLIARSFGFVSKLGSLLDSIADFLLFIVAAIGAWRFHRPLVAAHAAGFLTIAVLWIGVTLIGYLRYGRLASFHTLLTRIAAYLLGGFLGSLFIWGFQGWLFTLAVGFVVASQLEELVLMVRLPVWTPDARGLYWRRK